MARAVLTAAIVLTIASIANADLTLTVNGLDTTEPIEVEPDHDIIFTVAGQTDEQKESYSVTCEMAGKLEPLPEPNTLGENLKEGDYFFTFTDEAWCSVMVNLTVGDVLDYQLVLFKVPDANTIIFGFDSDSIEIPELEPEPEPESDQPAVPNKPEPPQEEQNTHLMQITIQNTYEPPTLVNCPNEANPHRLEGFAVPAAGEGGQSTMGKGGYIELQEITDSLYLDPNEVYYVPYPPLLIHGVGGEEIDVVIPSGTTIVLAEDWDYGIVVYDGANVCFGEPASEANEPNSIYEPSDTNSPAPPVWVVGESGSPFFNNFCGIFIDRTAGTRSKLDNIYLSGHYYGIQVDQQLDYPISNIYALGCYNGILGFGPNKILNSSVSYYGIWSPEWPYDGYAYEFMSESWDGTIFFGGTDFEIYNCLADDGDYGFTANGLYEPNGAPNFYSRDCVATNSYTGFNCVNGLLGISVICPGLYNNYQNKNFPELPFTDPVYEVNDPFVVNPNDYRIFLDPNSQFVNHGSGLTPFPGWTTNINGAPDEGVGDIWPHYQIRGVDKWLKADLNTDNAIDMNDLAEFTDQWLVTTPTSADLNNDQIVNFLDFAILANQWLLKEMSIEIFDPETIQTVEPNNVQGYVGIELKDIPLYAGIVSVYLDNQLIGSLSLGWEHEEQWVGLQSDAFSNGWHTLWLVTIDVYGGIINHKPINVYFNNLLYRIAGSDYFHPDDDYKYSGFYDGSSTLEAVLTDQDGQTIWSDNYTGQHISIVIPGATFDSEQFCELSIIEGTKSGGSGVTKKDLTKKFKQADCPAGVRMVIVLPNKDVYKVRKPAIIECAEACNNRNVTWVPLYHHDVTEENLSFLYNKSSVRYIYWCGHGNSHVGRDERRGIQGVERTHTLCWRYEKAGWWDIMDNWHEIGAFSYTRQTFPDAPLLPDNWDQRGFDLCSLGMYDSGNKKIVFIDGCLSAFNWDGAGNDMAYAYGMYSLWNAGHQDQIYIGWRIKVLTATPGSIWDWVLFSTDGVKLFWERMGLGDDVYEALYYTDSYGSGGIKTTLWGLNGMMDLHESYDDSDDNIWIYGEGIHAELEP